MRYARFVFALAMIWLASGVHAQVRLPQFISDGMVLQRDRSISIWGWASPKEKVTVQFNGKQRVATTDPSGRWRVQFGAMSAGGPYTMTIGGKNKVILNDVLIGDVWLCAGQSNMVHQLDIHDVTYANDIATANYPAIRHFKVPTAPVLGGPADDTGKAAWKPAVSEQVRPFSAVAYFFAVKVYEKYRVPIGLIDASVGGSPIEAWISEAGFGEFPEILKTIEQNKDTAYVNGVNRKSRQAASQSVVKSADLGLSGATPWYSLEFVPRNWRRINVPGFWEDQGARDLNGVVWFRREIDVPQSMTNKEARLFMGRIVDANKVYINGKEVGTTTYQYPQRRYRIPADVLKPGKNLIVVRVTNNAGKGGFVPDKPYCLFAGSDTVDLKGYWQYKVGEVFAPATPPVPGINAQNQPTALFNGMVAPYTGWTLKGVLWYQGESNTGRAAQYTALTKALVADWRGKFRDASIPFIYAQLPNFMDVTYLPVESDWAAFREAQRQALVIPNTAMVVTIDLGEWNDLHPDNKKDVGERMALAALKLAYHEELVYAGPLYKSHQIDGNKVTIAFDHVGGGLMAHDGEELRTFAIAGEDRKFVWARATIEGDRVLVWSDQVSTPKYVRYAWADNPDYPNLYNKEGLPASPFALGE